MIDELSSWFLSLSAMEQVYWGCAIIGSVIFLIQLILTLIGMDSSDVEVDFDCADTMDLGGGMSLFTVRGMVNFLVGFGWAGVSLCNVIESKILVCALAFVVGAFFVWIIMLLYRKMRHLEYNAAFCIDECKGKTATVYLRIPAQGGGYGKVQISVRGSIHEIDACTSGGMIPTGAMVRVKEVVEGKLLQVERLL